MTLGKRGLWTLMAALLAWFPAGAWSAMRTPPKAVSSIAYTLSPHLAGGRLDGLSVTIRMRADADGTTEIGWESDWDGETRLWQWARDFRVAGASSSTRQADGRWLVRSAPGAALTIRYRIVSAIDHDPGSDKIAEPKPIVRPRWFYGVGEALFAYPIGHEDAPATFRWTGAPKGFGFASDLQQLKRTPNASVADLVESVAIGGWPLHVSGGTSTGGGVRVATIGHFAFPDRALDTALGRIVTAERDFWHDRGNAPMLVTALAIRHVAPHTSSMGTGRGDAFAMWIDETAPLDSMIWLLGHEYFHHWNPARLGALPEKDEAADYWLSEGFTDYYARALLVRAGIVTPAQFAGQWNQMLDRYARASDRGLTNADMTARYYDDSALHDLPYQRGAMLAALWNRRLRTASTGRYGLDDVMRSMERPEKAATDRDVVLAFVAAAHAFGLDVTDDIRRYVTEGQPIALPADTFGRCATVEDVAVPDFDLGFDYAATQQAQNRIAGVRAGSRAYAAGVRDGMTLLALLSGDSNDSSVPVVLRVADGESTRIVRFEPIGTTVTVRQHMRVASESAACAATLSGE